MTTHCQRKNCNGLGGVSTEDICRRLELDSMTCPTCAPPLTDPLWGRDIELVLRSGDTEIVLNVGKFNDAEEEMYQYHGLKIEEEMNHIFAEHAYYKLGGDIDWSEDEGHQLVWKGGDKIVDKLYAMVSMLRGVLTKRIDRSTK